MLPDARGIGKLREHRPLLPPQVAAISSDLRRDHYKGENGEPRHLCDIPAR
ncbi:MAG TPA: hypothetical protein VKT73_15480 [Xanthobacteraceae bacterium]|nr:hypothetical protein [Xanthobacteraceae bacterium]